MEMTNWRPSPTRVNEKFRGWLAMQETTGRAFSERATRVVGSHIRDHIAGSVSMDVSDFQYAPFSQQGGLRQGARTLSGVLWTKLLEELNMELVK